MMSEPATTPPPLILLPEELAPDQSDAVLDGAAAAAAPTAVVEVTGGGAVQCIQGLFTNDIEKPGDGGFLYGATLTPKGMIISDFWVARNGGRVWLTVPSEGVDGVFEVFKRSLPPRLARAVDRSVDLATIRLVGPQALEAAGRAGIAVPQPGRADNAIVGSTTCLTSRPSGIAPFALQIQIARADVGGVMDLLERGGVARAPSQLLEVARVLAGWPRLGAEIDDKTLPQEVRYDDLGGVSYTKGCYTGQETVARLHFRGRANRHLAGLVWDDTPELTGSAVTQDGRERGRITSVVWLGPVERYIGLTVIRREVLAEHPVTAAGATARIVRLPFMLDE